jgi:hypothetical protein
MVVGNLDSIMSTFSDWGKGVLDFFSNLWNSIVDSAVGAFNRICDAVRSAINAITGLFNDLWNALTKHSIWTDMWKDMILQTEAGLSEILAETERSVGSFEKMFAGTAGGLSVQGTERSPGAMGSAASTGPTHMTVPITITVQHMTGEVKDLENLTRMICRELGSTVKWRV